MPFQTPRNDTSFSVETCVDALYMLNVFRWSRSTRNIVCPDVVRNLSSVYWFFCMSSLFSVCLPPFFSLMKLFLDDVVDNFFPLCLLRKVAILRSMFASMLFVVPVLFSVSNRCLLVGTVVGWLFPDDGFCLPANILLFDLLWDGHGAIVRYILNVVVWG